MIPNLLLSTLVAEVHMTNHHHPVHHHHHRDDPDIFKYLLQVQVVVLFGRPPIEAEDKHSEESDEDAKVAVTPDSDGEHKEHDTNEGDVCEAVQQHHAVHQGALLQLEPDQHQHIDGDHCEVVGDEDGQVGGGPGEVLVDEGDVLRVRIEE